MIFDSNSIRDWHTRGITDVSCFLIEKGCAGQKISIVEGIHPDTDIHGFQSGGITFHTCTIDGDFFDDIRITKVGKKWIASGGVINTHCGCGSSFSRKTGNPLHDKIARTKELIRQKKEKSHE